MTKSRKRRSNHSRKTTQGFQPVPTTVQLAVNATLTASTATHWEVGSSSQTAFYRPSSLLVRAAASSPTNLRFYISASDDSTTFTQVWSSATGLVGSTPTLIRLRAPRSLDPRSGYRWNAVSSGTPTLAGFARFTQYDPA